MGNPLLEGEGGEVTRQEGEGRPQSVFKAQKKKRGLPTGNSMILGKTWFPKKTKP